MSGIQPGLFLIMQRFTDRKDLLRYMYLHSETFQTICDDYRKCAEALNHWTRSGHSQASERRSEYLEMLRDWNPRWSSAWMRKGMLILEPRNQTRALKNGWICNPDWLA